MNETQHTKPLSTFTAHELQRMEIAPLKWIVEEILPEGLILLLAPPKYGKSWFAQQLCWAVALGEPFLGFQTLRGDTLYLALESSKRQLQDRQEYIRPDGVEAPDNYHMAIWSENLGSGLIAQLKEFVAQHPQTVLIVIDLLAKIRAPERAGTNAYYADYGAMEPLKSFADEFHVCVLVLHHYRKSTDETDFMNNASGSNGITGAADAVIGIQKDEREDKTGKLLVTGRDVRMQSFPVELNAEEGQWRRINAPLEPTADPLVRAVQALLQANGGDWQGTMSEFAAAAGFTVPGKDAARVAGRHLAKVRNQLLKAGLDYEKVPGIERKYRFWREF